MCAWSDYFLFSGCLFIACGICCGAQPSCQQFMHGLHSKIVVCLPIIVAGGACGLCQGVQPSFRLGFQFMHSLHSSAKLLFACLLLLQGERVDFVREYSRLSVLVSNLCTAYIAQQMYYLPVYYCCRGCVWTLLGSTAAYQPHCKDRSQGA